MNDLDARIRPTLERLTQKFMDAGATAVALTGSWARGDAHAESDIDLLILGTGTPYRLERQDGLLVSMSWLTFEQASETMRRPESALYTVAGWREARVLYDPEGLAQHLKDEADAWEFAQIEPLCRAWAAEEVTDLTEEVQKLAGLIERDRRAGMASQRAVLALKLAKIMAAYRGMLYSTENSLWDQVAADLGGEWAATQDAALGVEAVELKAGCAAALKLFALAAREVRGEFDPRQLAVVGHACEVAGHPLPAGDAAG